MLDKLAIFLLWVLGAMALCATMMAGFMVYALVHAKLHEHGWFL